MRVTSAPSAPGTGLLILDRPEKRNAIDTAMADEFAAAIAALRRQGAVTVVLRARGSTFCGGNDLSDLGPGDVASAPATRVVEAITSSDLFWVTVIEGPAVGAGAQIAAVSPVVLATPAARVELPEARMGLFPSAIFGQLSLTLGRRQAFTACLSGESIEAERARDLGLFTEVVAPEEIDGRLDHWLGLLADQPLARAAARSWRRHLGADHLAAREAELNRVLEEQFTAFAERRRDIPPVAPRGVDPTQEVTA
ncbi:enoyl-CoA hydratase/isomerase family protein [Patulibacter sp. S7RM1-6]